MSKYRRAVKTMDTADLKAVESSFNVAKQQEAFFAKARQVLVQAQEDPTMEMLEKELAEIKAKLNLIDILKGLEKTLKKRGTVLTKCIDSLKDQRSESTTIDVVSTELTDEVETPIINTVKQNRLSDFE